MARKTTVPKIYANHGPGIHDRLLGVIACPRAGTLYTSRVWRKAGVRVGHEYVDRDGTVSFLFAVDAPEYPYMPWSKPHGRVAHVGERRAQFRFKNLWHQIRHPLKSIGSMSLVVSKAQWNWLAAFVDLPSRENGTVYASMVFWLRWNQLCQRQADWTYRIEDMEEVWCEMTDRVVRKPIPLPEVSKTTNRNLRWSKPFVDREQAKKLKDPTWEVLAKIDADLTEEIREYASEFGYE